LVLSRPSRLWIVEADSLANHFALAYMGCAKWRETSRRNNFRMKGLSRAAIILDPALNADYMPRHDDACCSAKSPPPP
jgi:hypothetical protein